MKDQDHRKADLDCIVIADGNNITPRGIGVWSPTLPSVVLVAKLLMSHRFSWWSTCS